MSPAPRHRAVEPCASRERGTTLVEIMIALVVISVGILAVGQLFPGASRSQLQSSMTSTAEYYAQQKLEQLAVLNFSDANLSIGRHPAGTATEDLGSGNAWHRFYQVDAMAAPLGNLKRVTVTVTWTYLGARSVTAVTYARK